MPETALIIVCAASRSLSGKALSERADERKNIAARQTAAERGDLLFGICGDDAADPFGRGSGRNWNRAENVAAAVRCDFVNSGNAVDFGGVENRRIVERPNQTVRKTFAARQIIEKRQLRSIRAVRVNLK